MGVHSTNRKWSVQHSLTVLRHLLTQSFNGISRGQSPFLTLLTAQWVEVNSERAFLFSCTRFYSNFNSISYLQCVSLFSPKISSQIKPAKFETFNTETYFRLKNSLTCQNTKFARQILFPLHCWVWQRFSYSILKQLSD